MAQRYKRILRLCLLIWVTMVVFQPAAIADIPTYTLTLKGTDHSWNMGGVYTSPYNIEVNVVISGSRVFDKVLALACDDFVTDINFGWAWYATKENLSQVVPDGPQKFSSTSVYSPDGANNGNGTTWSVTPEQVYYAAGWLAQSLLYSKPVYSDSTQSGLYSYAIWQLFDREAYKGYNPPGGNYPYWSSMQGYAQQIGGLVDSAITAARASYQVPLNYVLDIYTPCGTLNPGPDRHGCTSTPEKGASQEFLGMRELNHDVTVSEGSVLAFLPFDLSVLFGGIYLFRKRFLAN